MKDKLASLVVGSKMDSRIQQFLLHVLLKKPVPIFLSYALGVFSSILLGNNDSYSIQTLRKIGIYMILLL